ncbi:hypothetical protein AMECASPLE_000294 [Ameca splendens]|uniref:Uncharacterized protein n=1 Tax=Ameca splendens TaxID=208324 RepID=A0ABV0XXZ4_9TELE
MMASGSFSTGDNNKALEIKPSEIVGRREGPLFLLGQGTVSGFDAAQQKTCGSFPSILKRLRAESEERRLESQHTRRLRGTRFLNVFQRKKKRRVFTGRGSSPG